jgi:cephalosporin-C deacetylase-like acetyl esterase
MPNYDQKIMLQYLQANIKPELTFDPNCDLSLWKEKVRNKLLDLMGQMPEKNELSFEIEYEKKHNGYLERRFNFKAEIASDVPCHLLLPNSKKPPYPLVICLQGHSPGMHISLGKANSKMEEYLLQGGRDFAIQAVNQGYAALAVEQRCLGERKFFDKEIEESLGYCHHMSLNELMYGRTMIGLRSMDISRAIDVIEKFDEIDSSKIACMGNSGGGTITYFASCIEPRIKVVMSSCYICSYSDSIGTFGHCACNYIPNIARYFDIGDLAILIAPRPLIVIAGRNDPIFPLDGVKKAFNIIEQIYIKLGHSNNCRLIIGDGGHQFYPNIAWPVFKEMSQWDKIL